MACSTMDGWGCDPEVSSPAPPDGPVRELAAWLAGRARLVDGWEADWLLALARFDELGGWALDGALSCKQWLVTHLKMASPTAYEKLRVARELARRPVLAEAFAAGRIGYSAVRLMARAVGAVPAVDAALMRVAVEGSLRDLEIAVLHYLRLRDQDLPPAERQAQRGFRVVRLGDGMVRVEAVLTELEAEELSTQLDAIAHAELQDEERPEPYAAAYNDAPVEATSSGPAPPPRGWSERMVDALMEMVRGAAGPGGERYLVHLVEQEGVVSVVGGGPLAPAEEGAVRCDSSQVVHLVAGDEPLRLGRRARVWNTAQRRAILVRDGGHCRFPGCSHRMVDVHHLVPWSEGGATDVNNGLMACKRHHALLHDGWTVTGDVNATLVFHRPGFRLRPTA